MPSQHSDVVGGSTAKRVINCPASVGLCAQMPKQLSSSFADEGTLLHDVVADILDKGTQPDDYIGRSYMGIELTADLIDEKLQPALDMFDAVDPEAAMEFAIESEVGFGDFLPGVFGSADILGRIGDVAYVIDWKFGQGTVDATENDQMLFYAAAAMRTPDVQWVFDGATRIVCVIIQPAQGRPSVWETTPARVAEFEQTLAHAVKLSGKRNPPMNAGDWCRWCAAKTICPLVTGQVERAYRAKLDEVDVDQLVEYLSKAEMIDQWVKDLYGLATQLLEAGKPVKGFKLVQKRAMRKWIDASNPGAIADRLAQEAGTVDYDQFYTEPELLSPAQAEKVLKKHKVKLPEGLVHSVSSGTTIAPESDPRPAVLQLGDQLRAALAKLS